MDVPEAFFAGQLWQEQWPSMLLPILSIVTLPVTVLCSGIWREGLSLPHQLGACLCTRNGAENCLFIPQKDGGPCLGDWMFMILSTVRKDPSHIKRSSGYTNATYYIHCVSKTNLSEEGYHGAL